MEALEKAKGNFGVSPRIQHLRAAGAALGSAIR